MSPANPPTGTPDAAPEASSDGALTGPAAPGRLLATRYRLEVQLASGGMAQVWQATDEVLRRKVAVKLLHQHLLADGTFVARFRQEAVAAARLAHPGIVSIFDTCTEGDIEAIVMELLPGRTLRERLDEGTPIDPWQAAALAAQVADALDAAHRAGLVHRDIKPANILLADDGRVKVADFGIAKAVADADLTQPGLMVGTAKYLAPEQVTAGPVDARTDIYSLGVVLYEMLCGRPPFAADSDTGTALARLHRDPLRPRQVRPSVPRGLEDVVVRAMARQPEDRYRSAADMRAALLAAGADPEHGPEVTAATAAVAPRSEARPPPALAATTSTQIPEPPRGPTFTQTERSWMVPTLLVVTVAVALGVAGLLVGRSGAGDFFGGVRDAFDGGEEEEPAAPNLAAVSAATAFDPEGDPPGEENNDDAPLVIDGDPATSWSTEGYNARDITALKSGVGLVLDLESTAELDRLEVRSPTAGWRAQIFVADEPANDLAGWGQPIFSSQPIPAAPDTPASFALKGTRGGAVLIWIIDAGDEDDDGRHRVELQEAQVFAR